MKKHYTIQIDADEEIQPTDKELLNAIHMAVWDRVQLASLAEPRFEIEIESLDYYLPTRQKRSE
jgi:hypothetical protein